MKTPNPFLQEGFTAAFGRRAFRRTYMALVACLAILLIMVWPKSPLADFLRGNRSPQAFQTVAIALLALLAYIGGRSGLEDFARDDFAGAGDLAALPSVPVRTIVAGKFLFAALHTGFLVCLGLPFLTAALTVSGFGLPALGRACLLIAFPALAVRAGAVFLVAASDIQPVPRNLILFTGVLALFLGNIFLAPAWSPILLLAADAVPAPLPTLYASFFHLVLVSCFIGASLLAMALRRRRAGGRKSAGRERRSGPLEDSAAAFLTLVEAFKARERRLNAASGALRGVLAGMAAGLLVCLLRPFLPPHAPWVPALIACVPLAALAGAVAGRLRRPDADALLPRLDRALGARCLLSTAYGLAARGGKTLYREAILDDAGRLLSAADPRVVLPLRMPARLRWFPALLSGILFLAVLPADLRGLLPRRAAPDRAIASLGRELEEYGRKLSEDTDRRGLPRSLEIGRSLQRLGQEMETEPMEADEALERMEELSERARQMQLAPRNPSDRTGSGGTGGGSERAGRQGGGESTDGSAGEDGSAAADQSGEQGDGSGDEGGLESAQGFLDRQRMDPRLGKSGNGNPAGEPGDAEADAGGGGNLGSDPGRSAQAAAPGTTAVPDTLGPPSDVARSSAAPEPVSPPRGDGDYAKLLLRILPTPGEARAADPAPSAEYGKLAESALSRADVPLELRGFVKEYFLRIGVLGE